MERVAQLEVGAWCLATPSPPKRIHAVAVHRWAGAETDADVALEAQVVAAGELEGVEARHQHLVLRVVLPVVEDGAIRRAAVGIRHLVLRLFLVVHRLGDAAAGETAVDFVGLHCDLQQEVVTDLGAADLLAIHSTDLHLAGGWGTRIGNGARCRDHADVEAEGDSFLAGVVDALDVVGPGAVGDQLGVLLDDQNEGGLPVDVHQAARVEEHLEVHRLPLAARHNAPALGVLAVALDVDHPVEAVQLHQHLHPVRQAHHVEAAGRNVGHWRYSPGRWRNSMVASVNLVIGVSNEIRGTHAYGNMVGDCARGAGTTDVARWNTLVRTPVALLVQSTVVVRSAALLDVFASMNKGISNGAGGADTVVAAGQVDAVGVRSTRIVDRDALVDVSAHPIRLQLKSSGTDAEAFLVPNVDAVLILGAGVGRCAVSAGQDAELSDTVVVGRTATGAARQADEVARAVVVHTAKFHSQTSDQRVARVARRTDADGLVVLHTAHCFEPTGVVDAGVIAVLL